MSVTIAEVARLARVSVTTVSHVINGTRFVSDELRGRVLSAMEELDYRPNVLARGLRRGETNTIGLIVPDNSNPFFAEILRVIEDVGFRAGYSVILCNSDGDVAKEAAYTEVLLAKQVDGIIFISTNNNLEHLSAVIQHGTPVAIVDRDMPLQAADVVLADNDQGGYEATHYLLALGHRRIACIAGPSELTPSADRVAGYRRALREVGETVQSDYIVSGDFRSGSGEHAIAQLLNLPVPPSAVFACNDVMAIGALRALRQAGISVPDDMSIIGFDDIPLASMTAPTLTTVAQPTAEMATLSANLLISRLHKGHAHEPQRIVLPTRLVVRESCAPSHR